MPDTQPTVEELSQVTLIKCIQSFQEGDGTVIQSLKRRLQTTCNDLADVKSKLSSPDSAINKKLEFMQQHITNQVEIITKQQPFLEGDWDKTVVLGVPESVESLAGVTSDEDKLKKIWSELGEELPPSTHQRLWREPTDRRKRDILVTLTAKTAREKILPKTNRMKDAGEPFSRIYIKKNVHPHGNDWRRWKLKKKQTGKRRSRD